MADNTKNSLSTLISQFLQLNRNSLEIFDKLNEAITSNKETVSVDLFDENNNLQRVQIPSFGFLKNEINRVDRNVSNLSGVGDSDTNVRLSDGSFRKVITARLRTAANNINELAVPTSFTTRNNWFFEDFLNPLMVVTLDLSGQIPVDTERIISRRYVLQLDTEAKRRTFNQTWKGKADIEFSEFIEGLLANNIEFVLDEQVRDVPPRQLRFVGTFDVLSTGDTEVVELVDGTEIKKRRKTYRLNKLTYTDLEASIADTVSLKKGDSLLVNSGQNRTRYKIVDVDSATNNVVLELVEGFEPITIGSNILSIFRDIDTSISFDIPIGFDESQVIFIKPIDPVSKIPSENFSPGIGFFTNELLITNDDGEEQTLDVFYRNEVTDFGLFLLSLAKDRIPPSVLAVKPDPPVVSQDNFSVVQTNQHLTQSETVTEIQQLADERNNLSAEIKELDTAIGKKRELISLKQFKSEIERSKEVNELNALVEQRASASALFASIVKDIAAKAQNADLKDVKPEFSVRGFWPIPEPKSSKFTGEQRVVQFKIEYRKLSTEGGANNVDQLTFMEDEDTQRQASFSNWVPVDSKVAAREVNPDTGEFDWVDEDVEDADAININQIDIPIRQGESIEIRIRSVSEAGFPSNPAISDYSSIVRVDFPDDLIPEETIQQILEENNKELTRVRLEEDLQSRGIDQHLASQFTANDKFFAHDANVIASGFLSPEQTPITLFDKLIELENEINRLTEILDRAKGELVVKILDDEGNETVVERNSLNKFFAGFYADLVSDLDVKKGAIVARTYFIRLENTAATPLELISRIPGDRSLLAFESGGKFGSSTIDPEIASDTFYINRGKYDYVPIIYTNPENTSEDFINSAPFQSGQVRGQFMYARYKNISGSKEFYIDFDIDSPSTIISDVDDAEYRFDGTIFAVTGNPSTDFVWKGDYSGSTPRVSPLSDGSVQAAYDGGTLVLLHADHPLVAIDNKSAADIDNDRDVINAKTAKLTNSQSNGLKQTGFFFDGNRTIKASFGSDDQFTLGKASVGSYLFVAVNDENQLVVEGDDALSLKVIEFGPNNAIQVPLVFQFRMTDYGGVGDTGIGFIGGDRTGATKDLTYAKRMGFDIVNADNERFSFDIEVFAKYRSNKLNLEKVPKRDVSLAIGDLSRNLPGLVPNIINRAGTGAIGG